MVLPCLPSDITTLSDVFYNLSLDMQRCYLGFHGSLIIVEMKAVCVCGLTVCGSGGVGGCGLCLGAGFFRGVKNA